MQWLVDLVIEAIGIPPVYIDRGDHVGHDFITEDFIADAAWHDWDLSALVPAGAQAVNLHCTGRHANVGHIFFVRPKSHTHVAASCFIRTQISNLLIGFRHAIALDDDRIIEYQTAAPAWTDLQASVKGWWL